MANRIVELKVGLALTVGLAVALFAGVALAQGESSALAVRASAPREGTTGSQDVTPPSAPGTPTVVPVEHGDIFTMWPPSTDESTGVATYTVNYSGAATGTVDTTTTETFLGISADGTVTVNVTATDFEGNVSGPSPSVSAVADSIAPVVTLTPAAVDPWQQTSGETVSLSATDTAPGVVGFIDWVITDPEDTVVATGTVIGGGPSDVLVPEGHYRLAAFAYDAVDNVGIMTGDYHTDASAPVSTLDITPASPDGANGWYASTPDATITAVDVPEFGSGATTLTVNAAEEATTYPVPFAEGPNPFTYFASDAAGNVETAHETTVNVDTVAPTLGIGIAGWIDGVAVSNDVTFTISVTDATSGYGSSLFKRVIHGANPGLSPWIDLGSAESTLVVTEGDWDVFFRGLDAAGNFMQSDVYHVVVDQTTPTTALTTNPAAPDGGDGTWLTPPEISLATTDPAGYDIFWDINDGAHTGSTDNTSAVIPSSAYYSTPGTYTVDYASADKAGNREATQTATFQIFPNQPTTSFTLNPAAPDGDNSWYVTDPLITVVPTATAGIDTTFYRVNGSAWTTYTAPFAAGEQGLVTVDAYAVDVDGLIGPSSTTTFTVDTVAPTVGSVTPTITNDPSPILGLAADDVTSGLAPGNPAWVSFGADVGGSFEASAGAGGYAYTTATQLVQGPTSLSGTVKDMAGNTSAPFDLNVDIDLTAPHSTSDALPSYLGAATISLNATDTYVGVDKTFYVLDGGIENQYAGSIEVTSFGAHTLEFWSTDLAGNREATETADFNVLDNSTSLFLTAPDVVDTGEVFPVTALLVDAETSPVAGLEIAITRANDAGFADGSVIATGVTDASGEVMVNTSAKNGQKTYFKAEVVDPGPYLGSTATASVMPRVEYVSRPTPKSTVYPYRVQTGILRKYRTYTWCGFLIPRHAIGGHAVKVLVKKFVPGIGWVYYKSFATTNYRRYSFTEYRGSLPLPPGRFRLVPVAVEDTKHARTAGAETYVTVQ